MSGATRDGAKPREIAERLFAERRGYLLSIARQNTVIPDDAEEALQDSFAQFVAHYDPAGGAPALAWLTLVLKRECWAKNEKHRLSESAGQERNYDSDAGWSVEDLLDERSNSVEDTVERHEEVLRIGRHMPELKPDERTALSLLALGYGYKDIMAMNGWTYTKVNRCVAEGRAHLRRLCEAETKRGGGEV